MSKRDYYDVLASSARPASRTSRRPTASSPCAIIPTATPATSAPNANSRKLARPTTSSTTPRSVPPTTNSAMPRSTGPAPAARAPAGSVSARRSPMSSTICSAISPARAVAAAAPRRAVAAPTCATTRDLAQRCLRRQESADSRAGLGHLRVLQRQRRRRQHRADRLPGLRRPWPGASPTGRLLHHRAHVSDLPGRWPHHRRPVPGLRGLGPRQAREDAVGQHPPGRRGRHPHSPGRRGRGRRARRHPRRPLHFPLDRAASHLPARRHPHLLPRPPSP